MRHVQVENILFRLLEGSVKNLRSSNTLVGLWRTTRSALAVKPVLRVPRPLINGAVHAQDPVLGYARQSL